MSRFHGLFLLVFIGLALFVGPLIFHQKSLAAGPNVMSDSDLERKYGKEISDAIRKGIVLKDMTMEQVVLARGAADNKESIPPRAELWHYTSGEVAFDNGRVTYVSLEPMEPMEPMELEGNEEYEEIQGDTEEATRHLAEIGAAHSESQPIVVQAPYLKAGDTYIYESLDLSNPKSSFMTRRSVTSGGDAVVLSNMLLGSKNAKPRDLHYNNEWNLVRTRDSGGGGKDYSPPFKY